MCVAQFVTFVQQVFIAHCSTLLQVVTVVLKTVKHLVAIFPVYFSWLMVWQFLCSFLL